MITGSFNRWIRAFSKLASAGFRKRLNDRLAQKTLSLVRQSFATSTDPYGGKWAPLKYRSGRPLIKTGRLMSSVSVQVGNGFTIVATASYAGYHNYGTSRIPKRQFIPIAGLPPKWVSEYKTIYVSEVKALFAS